MIMGEGRENGLKERKTQDSEKGEEHAGMRADEMRKKNGRGMLRR